MQSGLHIQVNDTIPPSKAEILEIIWKGFDDGDEAMAEQDTIIHPFDSDDDLRAAGWLRNSRIAGL